MAKARNPILEGRTTLDANQLRKDGYGKEVISVILDGSSN